MQKLQDSDESCAQGGGIVREDGDSNNRLPSTVIYPHDDNVVWYDILPVNGWVRSNVHVWIKLYQDNLMYVLTCRLFGSDQFTPHMVSERSVTFYQLLHSDAINGLPWECLHRGLNTFPNVPNFQSNIFDADFSLDANGYVNIEFRNFDGVARSWNCASFECCKQVRFPDNLGSIYDRHQNRDSALRTANCVNCTIV
jgi:hypothetical protein